MKKFRIKFTLGNKFAWAYVKANNLDEALGKYLKNFPGGKCIVKIEEMIPGQSNFYGRFPNKTNIQRGWFKID